MSIIIPVHNQAPRLRLTLATLERQRGVQPDELEVIVVDDGSSDGVLDMLALLRSQVPYRLLHTQCRSGGCRGVPRNTGAQAARGELLIFLDADACAPTQLVEAHLNAHIVGDRVVLGNPYVIPGTEYLYDPDKGSYFPGVTPDILRNAEPRPTQITIDAILDHGDVAFTPHAVKGTYPGLEWFQQETQTMLTAGNCAFGWVAVIPHNLSVHREDFFRIGGFDPFLRHLEGWDFGIKARRAGCTLTWAPGAKSFHLYHWRQLARLGENILHGQRLLMKRYPDDAVEAALVWTNSQGQRDTNFLDELNLNNWRVVQRLHEDPTSRERLTRLLQRYTFASTWSNLMDYLCGGALNAPPPGPASS